MQHLLVCPPVGVAV